MELDGRVAVVTGGTRGVGAGIARAFLRAGARVVVCARRPPDVTLDGAEFVTVDLREAEEVAGFFDDVAARYGRLDTLVNNAGGTPTGCSRTAPPHVTHGSSSSTSSPR